MPIAGAQKKTADRHAVFFFYIRGRAPTAAKTRLNFTMSHTTAPTAGEAKTKAAVRDFFEKNYSSLLSYCHSRWNGSGQDVCHEAAAIALARYRKINFRLFCFLAAEAARRLRIHEIGHNADGAIITPRDEKTRRRLAKEFATAPAESNEPDPGALRLAQKLIRAEKRGQPCLWGVR